MYYLTYFGMSPHVQTEGGMNIVKIEKVLYMKIKRYDGVGSQTRIY